MPKSDFNPTFDPYQALVELNARMNRMEHAHNSLAHEHRLCQLELSVAIEDLSNLQKAHLKLAEFAIKNLNASNAFKDL